MPLPPAEQVSSYALAIGASRAKFEKSSALPENQTAGRAGDRTSQGPPISRRPDAWRVNDALPQLSISRSTLYALAAAGKLKLIRVAGRTLVPDTEIQRLAHEGA